MKTRALNALAGVICAAQKQGRRTPMGIAQAIDAAQMLQSPETAAELAALRAEVKRLRAQVADPTQQGTGAEYAVRANGQVMSILRPCNDTQDGEELVRQDTARRTERYRDTWPDAVMVRRAVRYGPWAEVAGVGESA